MRFNTNEPVYFIQKEILRTDLTLDTPMKIWCANSELFGYSECYDTVENICDKLNKENKYKNVRFAIHRVDKII